MRFARRADCELIVADDGSSPAARESFREAGARIVSSEGSRGARLARAVAEARGDVFFFLHADSQPPAEALGLIRRSIRDGSDAGAFSLAYEEGGLAMRWIAWWGNCRSRLARLPFGDQGIFCTRTAYERAGGFRDLAICDDVDFVLRVRRAAPFVVRPEKTRTSARRYIDGGVFRQVLRNWVVLFGYFAGVSPDRLARWYERPRLS